jgi:hypothetical protein
VIYQLGPREGLRTKSSFLSESRKNRVGRLAYCSRSKEPETANRMPVVIQDMLSPPRNRLFFEHSTSSLQCSFLSLYQNLSVRSVIWVMRCSAMGGRLVYRPTYLRKCWLSSKDCMLILHQRFSCSLRSCSSCRLGILSPRCRLRASKRGV